MANLKPAIVQLKAALKSAERDSNLLKEALQILNGGRKEPHGTGGRRELSAAARRRIAAAQHLRWQKWKRQQKKAA